MSTNERGATRSADDLRDAFDRAFAEPATRRDSDLEGFLSARCGGTSYLLALTDLGGFVAGRRIVALPSRVARLLGVTGIRGAVTPVYDLAAVLGHAPTQGSPKWIAVVRGGRVGLAFDDFGGHVRAARSAWIHGTGGRPTVRADDILHQIVDLGALVADIERTVRDGAHSEE